MNIETYTTERVDDQINYFELNASRNQRIYKWLKRAAIFSNIATMSTIALAFVTTPHFTALSVAALGFSVLVLATYQIEEFGNYGAKWEKFRLVAERIKSEKFMFQTMAGPYAIDDTDERERLFVETVESMLNGTDLSYFLLMVEPGRRIERRLQ